MNQQETFEAVGRIEQMAKLAFSTMPLTQPTLRDRFAMAALTAIVTKSPFLESPPDFSIHEKSALGAYEYADAMLANREVKS